MKQRLPVFTRPRGCRRRWEASTACELSWTRSLRVLTTSSGSSLAGKSSSCCGVVCAALKGAGAASVTLVVGSAGVPAPTVGPGST